MAAAIASICPSTGRYRRPAGEKELSDTIITLFFFSFFFSWLPWRRWATLPAATTIQLVTPPADVARTDGYPVLNTY